MNIMRCTRHTFSFSLGLALAFGQACQNEPTAPPNGPPVIAYTYLPPGLFGSERTTYVMSADGENVRPLNLPGVVPVTTLRWSSDGRRFVFRGLDLVADRAGVYVVDADGANLTRVPSDQLLMAPVWSPNGSNLTVYYVTNSTTWGFADIRVDGTGFRQIVGGFIGEQPSWSPDGATLLMSGGDGMWIVNADGSGSRRLIPDGYGGRWSPDGKLILFSGVNMRTGIWLARADGSGQRQLSATNTVGYTWAPDNFHIAAAMQVEDGRGSEIMLLDTLGGTPIQITHGPSGSHAFYPDWLPVPPP